MENKVCFLFGHATTPPEAIDKVKAVAQRHYEEFGIRTFIVGNRGNFDSYAATAIKALKQKYSDITLLLLLAYHPAERSVDLTEGFDNAFYPPIENVPRQYAIARANKYMVDTADSLICYVDRIGNSRYLLAYAQRRQEKEKIPIDNIALWG